MMRSEPSSPSPAAPDNTEVSMDLADEASEVSRIRMIPPFQYAPSYLDDGNVATAEVSDTISDESSVEDESDLSASSGPEEGPEEGSEEGSENSDISSKIFFNGYFMNFHKLTSDGTGIWKCANENPCKARLYVDIFTREKENIHKHNHGVASDEEIKLYGIDPLIIVRDQMYGARKVPDAQELRNVRERSVTRMVEAPTLEMQNNTIETAEIPYISAGSSGAQDMADSDGLSVEEVDYNAIIAQYAPELLQVNPSPSASLSGAHSNESPMNGIDDSISTNPRVQFEESFDVAPELLRFFRPSEYETPRSMKNPTTYMKFHLSMLDKYDEYHYTTIRINQRDSFHLREALEQFCGQKCTKMIFLFLSTTIRIHLNPEMLRNWKNDQYFLLDISPPNRWYLMCVCI